MILTVRESFRRLHYRLIRLKLLREHSFGQLTLDYRLLHIRPLSGLVLSAPAAMFVAWYSGMAISTHRSQNSVTQSEEPLTAELFQLHLHDRLTQDVRRLRMEEPNVRSELPTYNLIVRNDRLSQLDAMLPPMRARGTTSKASSNTKITSTRLKRATAARSTGIGPTRKSLGRSGSRATT